LTTLGVTIISSTDATVLACCNPGHVTLNLVVVVERRKRVGTPDLCLCPQGTTLLLPAGSLGGLTRHTRSTEPDCHAEFDVWPSWVVFGCLVDLAAPSGHVGNTIWPLGTYENPLGNEMRDRDMATIWPLGNILTLLGKTICATYLWETTICNTWIWLLGNTI
jgi:hypothetical protein